MNILDGFWDGPVGNARNFNGVHMGHPLFKNYPQVIYGRRLPNTFFWFEVEVIVGAARGLTVVSSNELDKQVVLQR